MEEVKGIILSVSAYPNPTTDFLNLKVENYDYTNLSFQLFDMKGKLIITKKPECNQASIGMSNLVPAMYYLNFTQRSIAVKTFIIIKN